MNTNAVNTEMAILGGGCFWCLHAVFMEMRGILQAESGLMSLCGPADGEASKYGVAIVDLTTAMMAANAIQAALIARFRTGCGQKVAASLYDSGIALLANVGNSHLATGKGARRYGNGHPTIVPYTTFNTADGVVNGRDAIQNAMAAGGGATLMQELEAAFSKVSQGVNTKSNGRYVFAGALTDTAPTTARTLADLTAAATTADLFKNDT